MRIETKLFEIEFLLVIDYLLSDGNKNVLELLDEFLVVLDSLTLAVSIDKHNNLI